MSTPSDTQVNRYLALGKPSDMSGVDADYEWQRVKIRAVRSLRRWAQVGKLRRLTTRVTFV